MPARNNKWTVCCLQGKPTQAKGQDRLGGRSRIKVEEENIDLYLSEVCVLVVVKSNHASLMTGRRGFMCVKEQGPGCFCVGGGASLSCVI